MSKKFFNPNRADSALSFLKFLWQKKFTQDLWLIISGKLFLALFYTCTKVEREKHLKMNIKYFHLLDGISVQRRRKS